MTNQNGYRDNEYFHPHDAPESEEFVYEGVHVKVAYETIGYASALLEAVMTIQLDDIAKMSDLPNPTHPIWRVRDVKIMDGDECLGIVYVDDSFATLRKKAAVLSQQRELYAQLDELKRHMEEIRRLGLLTTELKNLFDTAELRVRRLGIAYRRPISSESTISAVRMLEKKLTRLLDADLADTMVDGLMDGTLFPFVTDQNQKILDLIDVFTIRSGGIWETQLSEDDLRSFYREKVKDVTTATEVKTNELLLNLDDYVIEDDTLAPEKIVLGTRRGEREYDVCYSYSEVDNNRVPTAAIVVPQSVFEQFAASYGKRHSFPDLGYGIQLWVSVRIAGGKIVSGWADDKELINRVEKRKKGLGRRADGFADAPTAPPPWAHGQAARGSRRR